MKEEYLWDKKGEIDPEIERLENTLAVFRYQKIDAPALPSKIIPFERKAPRSFFRLAFTFAACAAFVIVSLGVWFQFSGGQVEIVKDAAETIAPQVVEKVANTISVEKPDDSIAKKVETPRQFVERSNVVKVRKSVPAVVRQNKTVAQNVEVKKPAVKLTQEEKYAYDQLMLALSITSSKFKMVKDKVESVEEQNAARQNER